MDFNEWAQYGIDQGWSTPPICATHDGIPHTEEEDKAWDEGEDPCVHVVRLASDPKQMEYIRINNPTLFQ